MPMLLPPKRRRSRPKVQTDEEGETSETSMQVSIICVLLMANLIVFCAKYAPDNSYALAAAPLDIMQMSP